MPTYNSPGVYTVEKDFSNFDPASSPTTPGIVGFASQGPTDKPTLITNTVDLERIFGLPSETVGGQGLFGAYEIMKTTNQLMYVRAQTTAASRAEESLAYGSCPFVTLQASAAYNGTDTPSIFNSAMTDATASGSVVFNIHVSGSDGVHTTTKPYFLAVSHPESVDVVVSSFQRTLSEQTDFTIEKMDSGRICFVGAHPGVLAGISVSALTTSGTATAIGTVLDFKTNQLSGHGAIGGGGELLSKTDSGTYVQFDGTKIGYNEGKLTRTKGVSFIGAAVADTGMDVTGMMFASGMFYNSSGWTTNAPISDLTLAGTLSTEGFIKGYGTDVSANASNGGSYTLRALHTGKGYNSASSYNGNANVHRGLKVAISNTGKFQQSVAILRNGAVEETYKTSMYLDSTNSGIPTWPASVINPNKYGFGETSQLVYGAFEDEDGDTPVTWTPPQAITSGVTMAHSWTGGGIVAKEAFIRFLKFKTGTFDFTGGANGDAGDHGGSMSDTEVVNALAGPGNTTRGVKAFTPETVEIDLLAIPGVHVQSVQGAAIEAAENKGTFLYVTSPPEGLSPQEAVDWHNGNYIGRTASINSSFAAIYYPHCKMFNTWTGTDQYIDPAIVAIKAMSKADNIAEVWNAPAGITRGKVSPAVLELERDLNQGDRDYIYGGGNALNPIINLNRQGICIWGQRTAQRHATALDRINVRRLAIIIRQKVKQLGLPFVFEPNDPITWSLITGTVEPLLEDILARRGIRSFKVFCDETTNTPIRVERGELWIKVSVVPTKAAESLVFEINVLGQQEA
tara:strand:+ start:2022 stop:4403 length:2382 start_codon:yes stop_codon:yes gene_type:complete